MIERLESGLYAASDGFQRKAAPLPFRDLDQVGGIEVLNDTDLDTETVLRAASEQNRGIEALQDALVTWTSGPGRGQGGSRAGNLADRDLFVNVNNVFDEMRVAHEATKDDIVSAFLDSSESLAFSRMEIECADEDETDIWAQIMDDLDIASRMREIWRDVNIYGQATMAVWYGKKSYKVRGKSGSGVKRKKQFANLTVPLGVTLLDPLKILPAGSYLFQSETLAYVANPTEKDVIDSWLLGDDDSGVDEIVKRLITAKFEPDYRDRKEIGNLGVDPNRLYILNPQYVSRITVTKPPYERFAPVRFRSLFELLDQKRQLKSLDRSLLLGGARYIILIRKGSDEKPAQQYEIANLQAAARNLMNVPIFVGDHRVSIDIITPKTDDVLNESRYTGLNMAIQARLYGMFMSSHGGKDDSLKLARVVARGLESRRFMQKRAFMRQVIMPTFEMNDSLTAEPDLLFYPKRIALDFDPSLATYLLDLRDRGDISRDSVLNEIDYDEATEAAKREVEKAKYDDIFAPAVQMLPGPPPGAPNDPKRAGRALGGNHGKGGNGNIGRGAGEEPRPKPGKPKGDDSNRKATLDDEME